MRPIFLLLLLPLAGCASGARHGELARSSPVFAPERFFAGRTDGTGTLKIAFSERQSIAVHSHGEVEADGTLVLDQEVEQPGKDPRQREWRIKRAGDAVSGTLSDATGPISGEISGNLLHLSFPAKEGQVQQWLYLQPDGRTVLNRMAVTKMGVRVATLEETIRKEGD